MTVQAKPIIELEMMPKCLSCGATLNVTDLTWDLTSVAIPCDYCGSWFFYVLKTGHLERSIMHYV